MTAKEYLNQAREYAQRVTEAEEDLAQIRAAAEAPRRVHLTGVISHLSKSDDPMASATARIEEATARLYQAKGDYILFRCKILRQCYDLDNMKYGDLLVRRYLDLKPFRAVAKDLELSEMYTRHLHGLALQAFEEKYADDLAQDRPRINQKI